MTIPLRSRLSDRSSVAPTPDEVRRIAAIADPIIRNLEITYCYYRLSVAMTVRTGRCANWCTFATWASRQAGRTIRGEDMQDALVENTLTGSLLRHPIQALWRALLRRGLLNPQTRLGRIIRVIHTPFDALEGASDAVARGNLKVFEEIGLEFARYLQTDTHSFPAFFQSLREGDPPEGQELLRRAFARYERQAAQAQMIFWANLEIGFHEQTRLQPEIRESLESTTTTAEDLGRRTLQAIYPGAWNWSAFVRRPLAAMVKPVAQSFSKHARELARNAITRSLMTLALPGTTLALGSHLDRKPSQVLAAITDAELQAMLNRFEPQAGKPDDCGASDWGSLTQRMHFILHLFRSFHDCEELLEPPFTPDQVATILAGTVPTGVR